MAKISSTNSKPKPGAQLFRWRNEIVAFDSDLITARVSREVRAVTGSPLSAWLAAIGSGDLEVVSTLIWAALLAQGRKITLDEVDEHVTLANITSILIDEPAASTAAPVTLEQALEADPQEPAA
jgi:hypothetical protein